MTTSCIPPRASRGRPPAAALQEQEQRPAPRRGRLLLRRFQPRQLTGLAAGMALALLWLYWVGPTVATWWQQVQEQYAAGTARITALDADVGHGGLSHLLAEDWHGTILVIEVWPTEPSPMRQQQTPSAGISPGPVSVCAFPHLLTEQPGTTPRLVTVQVARQPGRKEPVLLVHVEGVPFQLTCRVSATGLQAVQPLPGRTA